MNCPLCGCRQDRRDKCDVCVARWENATPARRMVTFEKVRELKWLYKNVKLITTYVGRDEVEARARKLIGRQFMWTDEDLEKAIKEIEEHETDYRVGDMDITRLRRNPTNANYPTKTSPSSRQPIISMPTQADSGDDEETDEDAGFLPIDSTSNSNPDDGFGFLP